MATELVLLGTAGGPTPKAGRAAPAQAILIDGHTYVVDAGNGVGRQLVRAGIPLNSLDTVFLTHHHSDHNADLGTLLLLAWADDLDHPVRVLGPEPTVAMLETFLSMQATDIAIRVADEGRSPLGPLIQARDIDGSIAVVHEDERVRVSCVRVDHPPFEVALGYRFDTADRSIVISGDTAPCPALVELAAGADVLVHEVIHRPSIAWLAPGRSGARLAAHLAASHTDVEAVGGIAAAAGVGLLVLSHLVPGHDVVPEAEWLRLASMGYAGPVVVGQDLMRL